MAIGINKIYIYNNGFNLISNEKSESNRTSWWAKKTFQNEKCKGEISKTWDLKPELDHFKDFSELQIIQKINDLQSKYANVKLVPWEFPKDHKDKYPDSQYSALKDFLTKSESDFFTFIDIDEYFNLPKKKLLQDFICNLEFDSLKIPQKPQPRRSRNKVSSLPDSNLPTEIKWGKNITKTESIKELVCKNERKRQWAFQGWNHHDGFNEDLFNVVTAKHFYYNHYKL